MLNAFPSESSVLADDPVTFAGGWLTLIQDMISAQGEEIVAEVGALTPARCISVMVAIARHEPVTVAELARWHGYSHQLMRIRVGELARQGLVKSAASKDDGRKQALLLTRRGKADLRAVKTVCRRARAALQSVFAEAGLDPAALPKFARALQRLSLKERSHDGKIQV